MVHLIIWLLEPLFKNNPCRINCHHQLVAWLDLIFGFFFFFFFFSKYDQHLRMWNLELIRGKYISNDHRNWISNRYSLKVQPFFYQRLLLIQKHKQIIIPIKTSNSLHNRNYSHTYNHTRSLIVLFTFQYSNSHLLCISI